MLILTRRIGEALMINDDITITVLNVRGQQVRLGITAPKSVAVHREEIYQRIRHEKQPVQPGIEPGFSGKVAAERKEAHRQRVIRREEHRRMRDEDEKLREETPGNYKPAEEPSAPMEADGNVRDGNVREDGNRLDDGIPEAWRE